MEYEKGHISESGPNKNVNNWSKIALKNVATTKGNLLEKLIFRKWYR